MKHISLLFVCGITTMALATGWSDVHQAAAQTHAPAAGTPSAQSASGAAHAASAAASVAGTVVETMNAGQYTYVQVDDGTKKIWAAAPQFAVAVGDKVVVPEGMPMREFHSQTLDKTFELVYFVSSIQVVGGAAANGKVAAAHGGAEHSAAEHGATDHGAAGHGMVATTPAAAVDLSNIKKADGGQTVAELFAKKGTLVGKDVAVRGRVVKYTPAVMGKNWIHVQDGTGSAGTNDLTVSTSATAAVGNTVLVRGKLSADKDLGFGYKYDILIEDAAVAVE